MNPPVVVWPPPYLLSKCRYFLMFPNPEKCHFKLPAAQLPSPCFTDPITPVTSSPSSQTSVSMLTASALLWRCCKFCPVGLQQFCCCLSFRLCAPKNGTIRVCSPIKPGVDSTPSSKSISDEDSESDAFFIC